MDVKPSPKLRLETGASLEFYNSTSRNWEKARFEIYTIYSPKALADIRTSCGEAVATQVADLRPAKTISDYEAAAEALASEAYVLNESGKMSTELRKDISSRAMELANDMESHGMKLTDGFCLKLRSAGQKVGDGQLAQYALDK